MSQAIAFLRQLVSVFSCSRRNSPDPRADFQKVYGVATKNGNKVEKLRGNRSNASTDLDSADSALVSTSGSETEVSSLRSRAGNYSNAKYPPGLSLAPDLEPEAGGRYEFRKHGTSTNLAMETKVARKTTPDPNLKLQECLQHITSSPGNELASSLGEVLKRRLQREEKAKQNNSLQNLEKILGKLTPEDAAIVKSAIKSKQVSRDGTRFPSKANISEENTLRSNLRKLAEIDAKRVFMVRKINKLGLSSPDFLKAYFSKFGRVENVYVTHNLDRRNIEDDPQARPSIRPAGVGFIVMEKAEDVVNIFQQGLEHTISDVCISLAAYEHHNPRDIAHHLTSGIAKGDPRFPSYANLTEDNTLRTNLRKMAEIDAARIFMVRKINKLGLGSCRLLKNHFGKVGPVTDVYVTHSIDRRNMDKENPQARPHVRPAGIGFVVMEKAEDVVTIFRNGVEPTVCGVKILLSSYEHQIPNKATDEGDELESAFSEKFTGSHELEAQTCEEPIDSNALEAPICKESIDSNELETPISEEST